MIYYIFEHRPKLSGVNSKILSKIKTLNKLGTQVKGVAVVRKGSNFEINYDSSLVEIVHFPEYKGKRIFKNRLFSFLNIYYQQKHYYNFLKNEIYRRKPNLVIKRYEYEDINTLRLIKQSKTKFLFEINTDQLEQIKSNWNYKGLFKSPTWQSYYVFQEKLFGSKVLRKADSLVCVTQELHDRVSKRIKNTANSTVVSNGILVDNYPLVRIDKNYKSTNLIMLLGVNSDWNGMDIIVRKIEENEGLKVNLFIVGNIPKSSNDSRIHFVGLMNQNEITDLIRLNHIEIGIGTLALERKGISEASPLKVREYLSRGLPVIYNYFDTDLDKNEVFREQFLLKFSGEMNLQILLKKYSQIKKIEGFNEKIRDWALHNVDYNIKLALYKSVIEKIN
jgi:hypothetical protein